MYVLFNFIIESIVKDNYRDLLERKYVEVNSHVAKERQEITYLIGLMNSHEAQLKKIIDPYGTIPEGELSDRLFVATKQGVH